LERILYPPGPRLGYGVQESAKAEPENDHAIERHGREKPPKTDEPPAGSFVRSMPGDAHPKQIDEKIKSVEDD
jgi:hypothetical protein